MGGDSDVTQLGEEPRGAEDKDDRRGGQKSHTTAGSIVQGAEDNGNGLGGGDSEGPKRAQGPQATDPSGGSRAGGQLFFFFTRAHMAQTATIMFNR